MNNYNDKTEELIKMYLSFSTNKNINIDEFVKLRKQAVKEVDKENGKYNKSKVIHPLERQEKTNKEEVKQIMHMKNIQNEKSKDTKPTQLNAEKMFLEIIKDIQD